MRSNLSRYTHSTKSLAGVANCLRDRSTFISSSSEEPPAVSFLRSVVELDITRKAAEFLPDFADLELTMGRIFETRKATMFARWNKMAKIFTRISREIAMAVKGGGPNPDNNPALRRALQNARSANMPKDKVETAIKRANGQEQQHYDVVLYEGYAPHGIALLVETATDNVVRTVANMRMHFKDYGGHLGTTGSVGFLFQHMGVFRLAPEGIDVDTLELDLIDHGLQEMGEGRGEKGEKQIVIHCAFSDFGKLQSAIEQRKLHLLSAESEYVPQSLLELPDEKATEVLKLVDALEQDEDVQKVFHNLK